MTKEINKLSNADLILSLKRLAKAERKITHLVLLHIIEVEERKLHIQLGYERVYSYLTKELGYSEHSAYERIRAAELLKKVPEVAKKIDHIQPLFADGGNETSNLRILCGVHNPTPSG